MGKVVKKKAKKKVSKLKSLLKKYEVELEQSNNILHCIEGSVFLEIEALNKTAAKKAALEICNGILGGMKFRVFGTTELDA